MQEKPSKNGVFFNGVTKDCDLKADIVCEEYDDELKKKLVKENEFVVLSENNKTLREARLEFLNIKLILILLLQEKQRP